MEFEGACPASKPPYLEATLLELSSGSLLIRLVWPRRFVEKRVRRARWLEQIITSCGLSTIAGTRYVDASPMALLRSDFIVA